MAIITKPTKKLWPPIHQVTYTNGETRWQLRYQLNGSRTSAVFKTKLEAETAAQQVRLKVANEGAAGFSLPRDVQVDAAAAVKSLQPYEGETIGKAVEFYVAHCLRFRNAPAAVEITREFIAEREQLNQRDRNLADVRQRLNVFARTFGTRKLAEITVEELAAWLRNPTWSARSQIHYRRRVSMLFDFAIKRRWCEVNIAALLDNPETEDKDVECFTVEECARILEHAAEADCLPLVVLSLFAGLRRAEVARLQWENVSIAERTITVSSKAAKKRSRRVISINDTAAAWLATCAKTRGLVVPVSKQELDSRIKELASLAGLNRWKQNGLRHCFCTYHLAAGKDPIRTAYEAGNSAEIVQRCYNALSSEATAKRFWALRPVDGSVEKIIPLAAQIADNGHGVARRQQATPGNSCGAL